MRRSKRPSSTNTSTESSRPYVKHIFVQTMDADSPALLRDEIAWVVFVTTTSAIDHGYWILVAASSTIWSRGSGAVKDALLAIAADLTRALGCALYILEGPVKKVVYAEPLWIWVLRDPADCFHLVSIDQNKRTAAWGPMPALDPGMSAGSRASLLWLFPVESLQGFDALDSASTARSVCQQPASSTDSATGRALPTRLLRFAPPKKP